MKPSGFGCHGIMGWWWCHTNPMTHVESHIEDALRSTTSFRSTASTCWWKRGLRQIWARKFRSRRANRGLARLCGVPPAVSSGWLLGGQRSVAVAAAAGRAYHVNDVECECKHMIMVMWEWSVNLMTHCDDDDDDDYDDYDDYEDYDDCDL